MNFDKCYNNSLKLLEEIKQNEVILPEIYDDNKGSGFLTASIIIQSNQNISSVRYLTNYKKKLVNINQSVGSIYIPEDCKRVTLYYLRNFLIKEELCEIPTTQNDIYYPLHDILKSSKMLLSQSIEPVFTGQEEIMYEGIIYKKNTILHPFNLHDFQISFDKEYSILIEERRSNRYKFNMGVTAPNGQKFILKYSSIEKIE